MGRGPSKQMDLSSRLHCFGFSRNLSPGHKFKSVCLPCLLLLTYNTILWLLLLNTSPETDSVQYRIIRTERGREIHFVWSFNEQIVVVRSLAKKDTITPTTWRRMRRNSSGVRRGRSGRGRKTYESCVCLWTG